MFEGAVQDLIDELGRLPGIGPKSAQRIAFHLLEADPDDVTRLATVLTELKAKARFCVVCGNVSEDEQCRVCRDPRRDPALLCVVEESKDVVAIERTREFRGRYHVLGGAISPLDGIGPDDLRIRELMTRLADGTVTEVILATDPNMEGEATAAFLARLLGPFGLRVTRLASGLPVGGDLEYADEVTLGRAFEGRRVLHAGESAAAAGGAGVAAAGEPTGRAVGSGASGGQASTASGGAHWVSSDRGTGVAPGVDDVVAPGVGGVVATGVDGAQWASSDRESGVATGVDGAQWASSDRESRVAPGVDGAVATDLGGVVAPDVEGVGAPGVPGVVGTASGDEAVGSAEVVADMRVGQRT